MKKNLVVILFFVSAGMMLLLSVYTSFMMNSFSTFMIEDIEERLFAVGRSAAREVTAAELNALQTPEDVQSPLFAELRERMIAFAQESNIIFVYYIRDTGDGMCQFIIDNDETEDALDLTSDPIEIEEMPQVAFDGHVSITDLKNYSVGFDGLLSVFAPVFDENGTVIAIAGVDISDEQILKANAQISTLIILLIICMLIVLICGFLNIFLHRKKDKERKEALSRAVQASKAKGDFLSNMSHEMRTPMNAIIGMTGIGKSSEEIDKKNYAFDRISQASTHLLGVINDILDMSKIEANKLELSPVSFRFDDVIQKVTNIITFTIEAKHQVFVVDIDPAIPPRLIGDDQRLTQVIANLLSNAVKFTPENGSISLSAKLERQEREHCVVEIQVTDSGIGISPEQQKKLFSSFSQADSGTSRKFGGTGLGLAISKHIVEMMGGDIHIRSELGQGSTFYFSVNVLRDESKEVPVDSENADVASQRTYEGHHILIAEDVEINREIVGALLEPCLIEIKFAENGKEAVAEFLCAPEKYDIIFMDVQMPEMNGFEATEKIRSSQAKGSLTIPIVAMTANVFSEDIAQCLAAGMNDHIGKPIDIQILLEKLNKFIPN